uniref:Polypeptide of 976 aa n=2 Tax=Culex quinquefasciatus TaxID=7176 RepID=A0A1S4K6B9_CULQU
MDLQILYQSMDVSHLSVDEVEHELYTRKITFSAKEPDSTKRRRLKEKMKEEKATKDFTVVNTWRKLSDELSIIKAKLHVIQGLLESSKTPVHQKIKLKTKLIHYRVRIFLASKASGAHKFTSDLSNLSKKANKLFVTHFPEFSVEVPPKSSKVDENISETLEEVRNEIEILNETVSGIDLEKEISGGENDVTSKIQEEIESTEKRKTEVLDMLDELEKLGNLEHASEMMKTLKTFVSQTADEQNRMREERIKEEERKLKEMEENMIRKKRLGQLLNDLTEKLKITESNAQANANDKGTNLKGKPKPDSETESTETDASWHISCGESSESDGSDRNTRKQRKKNKKRRSGKGKSEWNKRKKKSKRSRKHSFSSQSNDSHLTSDSESSSTTSDSFSSSSSDSSSDSEWERRKHKKYKKSRSKQSHLKRVAEWKLKYEGKDQGRKLGDFLK